MRKLCVAVLLVVSTARSRADSLDTNRGMPLREVAHSVDIRIENGVAIYTVQRQFRNSGKLADEVRLAIDLPQGAAATGLRIKAKDKWHTGELLEAELAANRYQELTGQGVFDAKDPALLYWVSRSELSLQMFPVFPGTVSTVEYTLKASTRYEAGRYWISYPRAPKGLARPVITVRSPRSIVVDGKAIAGTRATLPFLPDPSDPDNLPQVGDADEPEPDRDGEAVPAADPRHAQIGIAPPAIATWAARLARVVASDPHAFTRLELDVAPRLSQIPRRAQVVFVIDASFSAAELMPTQLAIVRQYAKHAPDAEIELVAFRRAASRVFGAFVPARDLERALASAKQRGALALGNGSALEAGARLAVQVIAKRTGTRRVVVTTDERLRGSLTNEAVIGSLAALDPATVVHLVIPTVDDGDGTRLERNDTSALAPIATRHHGIYARLYGYAPLHGTNHGAAFTRAVLELVRPLRIDHLAATGNLAVADTLEEGDGLRIFESRTKAEAPAQVTLTGKLWSDPIKLDVTPTRPFDTATAAFVFAEDLHAGLDAKEQMTLALAGRAVSPVTSYLAIEPGVRPSRIGLGGGGTGWGTIGTGRYGTIGSGSGSGAFRRQPDLQALVDTRACVTTHRPAAGWGVKLAVETTSDEIVDVAITNGIGPLADCLVETVWKLRLDARFDQPRESFVVDLF
jgi:hypothetical protein